MMRSDEAPDPTVFPVADSARAARAAWSRRTFLVAGGVMMASCSPVGRKPEPGPLANAAGAKPKSPVKPAAAARNSSNEAYRTPKPSGPVPQNPSLRLKSDVPAGADTTFTRVPMTEKFIAITFDDGPHPKNTPRLLDMLRERNIKATFYVIGSNVQIHPQIVRRTVAEGHELGNHSQTHRLLSKMSDAAVREDLTRCQDAIVKATGVKPQTLRPPYGGLLQSQRQMVRNEFGYLTILWSVDPLDWKRPGPSVVASRIVAGASPGGIVLAHDLHSQTVDAMPQTLDRLLRDGYKFVTVSQLIAMGAGSAASQASVSGI